MCVGKALTGGYLTLAATLCTADIAQTISTHEPGALMHGPTFMANALACAVSIASVELLLGQDWRARVREIESGLNCGLQKARAVDGVADVRVLGAIGVIEMSGPVDLATATPVALDHGVWLRPFRNLDLRDAALYLLGFRDRPDHLGHGGRRRFLVIGDHQLA